LPICATSAWFELRRALRLERIQAPGGISPFHILLSLLIPGYAFIAMGRRHIGRAVVTGYVLAAITFFVLLGFALANILFGLMIAAHAISILWILRLWIHQPPAWLKVGMVVTLLALLSMALYWPCLRYVEENWFMPLNTPKGVVVVKRGRAPAKVQVGEVIAYRINAAGAQGLRIADGFGIEPVLALGGDRIEFTPAAMLVNGQSLKKQRGMPDEGMFVVSGNGWFIWPNLDTRLNGAAGEAMLGAALLRLAIVSHDDFIGKPYRSWFGRVQKLP
jgi:hypothetical protein